MKLYIFAALTKILLIMIKQTPICFKLDTLQLQLLDNLCNEIGCNRNKLLNFFVLQGISYLSDYKKCLLTSAYRSALNELLK